jgi:hypothetical protein
VALTYKDFLLAYEINTHCGNTVEVRILHIASALTEFLEMNPVYISKDGVTILYMGSRLILEPRDCPSGMPQGIILPRLPSGTSERSNRPTVELLPGLDLIKNRKKKSISTSETVRDKCPIMSFGSITLRNEREATEYVNGICRTMSELTQAFIYTSDTKKRAITLIINN